MTEQTLVRGAARPFAITVLGVIDPDALGPVYPHEHLLTLPPAEIGTKDPDLVLDDAAEAAADLALFASAGGRTVVELTTPDYGRDVSGLARLSRTSGVNIIAATGFNKALYSERLLEGVSTEDLQARFTAEVLDGVKDSKIRCGVIKVGTSLNEVKPTEERVLRAAAATHLVTGCPITTHTERGTLPEEQLDLFAEESVPASAVVISHLDFTADVDVVRRVARRGAFVEFDQAPKPKYALEDEVIRRVLLLAREGLDDRILVSGDFSRKSYFRHWSQGPGLGYLLGPFRHRLADSLRDAGLGAEAILERIFVENPRRAFSFRGPGAALTAARVGWS